MTLIINNDDVARLLTIEATMDALEQSYRNIAIGEATCRPRIDIRIPTSDPAKTYQFGSMEGGSTEGYFAVRMKSDVIYETAYNGAVTREKYSGAIGCWLQIVRSWSQTCRARREAPRLISTKQSLSGPGRKVRSGRKATAHSRPIV